MATLSAFLGVLAMLIATVGLYGVLSYMVSRRRVEIGVRIALGADPRKVVRMVLGETGWLLTVGFVAGVGLAIRSCETGRQHAVRIGAVGPVIGSRLGGAARRRELPRGVDSGATRVTAGADDCAASRLRS